MSGAADEQVAQAKKFALEHLQQTPDDALHLLKMKDVYDALRLKGLDVSADRSLKDAVKATITEFAAKREEQEQAAAEEEDDDEPAIPLGEPEAKRQKKAAPAAAAAGGAPAASSSSSRAAAPPAAEANGGAQHNAGEKIVLLDEAKRVTPGDYRGHKYIDIREWYKDKGSGEWKPGKKGITLSKPGWQKLITLFPTVDGWLDNESADEGTTWTVIEKTKRVSFNMYKGRKQIDIREYYKDGDVEKPGKKGIALSMSCYEKIKSCANNVATWI